MHYVSIENPSPALQQISIEKTWYAPGQHRDRVWRQNQHIYQSFAWLHVWERREFWWCCSLPVLEIPTLVNCHQSMVKVANVNAWADCPIKNQIQQQILIVLVVIWVRSFKMPNIIFFMPRSGLWLVAPHAGGVEHLGWVVCNKYHVYHCQEL